MTIQVAQVVTSLARGGAQATVLGSSQDHGSDIDVTVLAGPEDPGEGTYWDEAEDLGIPTVVVPRLRRAVAPRADADALRWLVRWLRRHRPDVVHTHSAKAGLLGRVAASIVGIPAVHTVHGWSSASVSDGRSAGAKRRGIISVERALAGRSRALVVVTPLDAEEGLRHRIGSVDKYRVIRSGIDLAVPRAASRRRAELRGRLGLDRQFVFGTVGRLADQKDHETLLAGFEAADIDDSCLVIIGDGPRRLELKRQVAALGLGCRVRFLGHRSDAVELLGAFDAFVSTARWEGLPRTIIEAMAAEVPVIATPVGGVGEVVVHGRTGSLITVGDPIDLAAALNALVEQPDLGRQMAERASAQVEAFSVEYMRADLRALWCEVGGHGRLGSGSSRDPESTTVRAGVG